MATIYDVDAQEFITKLAEELKKNDNIKPPSWARFVKTGASRERPPENPDWWFVRCASVLRTVYRFGPIGVSKLRRKYGGKKNRGAKPEHHYDGSGSIARKIFQQLEKAGLLKKSEQSDYKGRVLSPQGRSFIDKIATSLVKVSVKKEAEPKKEATKKESKETEDKKVSEPTKKSEEPKQESKAPGQNSKK